MGIDFLPEDSPLRKIILMADLSVSEHTHINQLKQAVVPNGSCISDDHFQRIQDLLVPTQVCQIKVCGESIFVPHDKQHVICHTDFIQVEDTYEELFFSLCQETPTHPNYKHTETLRYFFTVVPEEVTRCFAFID